VDAKNDPRDIVSSRLIAAPREKIFRAYAQAERLARWWGPAGFRSTFENFDFRPGGEWKFMFHGPDGKDYPNHSVFREIEKPSRIVIEHTAPHFVLTMTMQEEGGKTRLHWRQRFDTAQHRDQVAPICIPSNEQNFDRLEAELDRMN
jgi:uncharacterized protein YndB with AHSA1/START domain